MSSADPLEAVHVSNIARCTSLCMGLILSFGERQNNRCLVIEALVKGGPRRTKQLGGGGSLVS